MRRFIPLILAVLTGLAPTSGRSLGQFGRWHLIDSINEVSLVRRVTLGLLDAQGDAAFALTCTSKGNDDAIFIEAAAFKSLPFGQQISVSARTPKGEPYPFPGMADGNGKFVILRSENAIVFGQMIVLALEGDVLGVALGESSWLFPTARLVDGLERFDSECAAAQTKRPGN
jgi:hypothetical protein